MTVRKDLEFNAGENWRILLEAHAEDGTILQLVAGSDVQFKVIDDQGIDLFTQTVGDGVTITSVNEGKAAIIVPIEDLDFYGVVAGKIYLYEIRVIRPTETTFQAEGRVGISYSLFAEIKSPLVAEFRARFPEFDTDDTILSLYIKDATKFVDDDGAWPSDQRSSAIVHMAAHLLMKRKNASAEFAAGGLSLGNIQTITVEGRTVSFGSTSSGGAKTSLSQTPYGRDYLALMRRNVRFVQRA